MKKFLFTLIVAMLTCMGAWAQEIILINGGADGITSANDFKLNAGDVPSSIQAGDILKLDYEITNQNYYYIGVATKHDNGNNNIQNKTLFYLDNNHKDTSKDEYVLTAADVTDIKTYGIFAINNQLAGLKIKKLSLIHYDAAESISLDVTTTSVGIGSTTTLIATVNPSTADQKVTWSSNAESVATVENGVVTGKAAGTATITATVASNTSLTATCTVTVKQGYDFTISPANSVVVGRDGGTITLVPTVKLGGELKETGYSLSYALVGENADVTVSTTTGVVTVAQGAATATAKVKVTLTPESDDYAGATAIATIDIKNNGVVLSKDGDFVVVTVINAGEFVDEHSLIELGANVQELKDAENVKVNGLLSNSDVRALIHLIGDGNAKEQWNVSTMCKTLDMSGAQMTEEVTSHNANGQTSTPSNSWINDDDYWNHRLFQLESLSLPKPCPDYTVLPSNMYVLWLFNKEDIKLKSLVIPEGWTETASNSFSEGAGNPMISLTTLKLPDSMEKIGAYSFAGLKVSVLDMPYNIKRIGDHAFNSCQKLEDVYFYGPAPDFVHTDAFGGDSQMANNTVNDNLYNNKYDPTTTRFNYQVVGVLACLLHYPKEYEADYIDMTRVYEKRNPNELYKKGNSDNQYSLPKWTQALIDAVNTHPDHYANAKPSSPSVDYGVKDQFYGDNMIWPSQSQMELGYALAKAGYKWTGDPLDADQYAPGAKYEDEHSIDKRGLYQFIVGMGNSTIGFKYEQDKWYTISLPFNMSVDEIKRIFGANTQVCRFSKVIRETKEGEKEIRLEFRKSVMGDRTGEYSGVSYPVYGGYDAKGNYVEEPAFESTGIIHHRPYMIKPSGTVTEDPAVKIDGSKRTFNGKGFIRISGTLHDDAVTPVNHSDAPGYFTYAFCPILEAGTIKPNSYILINENGTHKYAFYKGKKNTTTGEYEAGGSANQNTAYVQVPLTAEMVDGQSTPTITDWGKEDLREFFTAPATSPTEAKNVKSLFGDEYDDTTDIEKVVIVCGNDDLEDEKVYTIGGQLIKGSALAPGLYIKNGKKFVVK